MIEGFARHNGHADLLRQRIDGLQAPGTRGQVALLSERRSRLESGLKRLALTCAVKAFQVSAAKVSRGPSSCWLSRIATAGPAVPTSTQVPPLLPLWLLLRHVTGVMSSFPRPLS
jgi:hypothetical protein